MTSIKQKKEKKYKYTYKDMNKKQLLKKMNKPSERALHNLVENIYWDVENKDEEKAIDRLEQYTKALLSKLEKEMRGIKKRKVSNRTTDEKRYPIGYNQALKDIISLLNRV